MLTTLSFTPAVVWLVMLSLYLLSVMHSVNGSSAAKKCSVYAARILIWVGSGLLIWGYFETLGAWVVPVSFLINLSILLKVENSLGGRVYHSGATRGDRSNIVP
jgi:hypothetical protein